MVKIIRYLIIIIIFSIIASLFGIYFYLIKGIEITNIHFQNINIAKLYIKIDKKLILKGKNITIHTQKTDQPSKINFKESNRLLKRIIQYLNFFQEIEIKNLSINKNRINLILLKDNIFTIDNDTLFLQASISPKIYSTYFVIYELNIKPLKLIINNINGKFWADLRYLYVNLETYYKNSNIKAKLKVTNSNLFYDIDIYNITKNLLNMIKLQIPIDKFNIFSIHLNGDIKEANFEIKNSNITIKKHYILIPQLDGTFKKEQNILSINTHKIKLFNDVNLSITDTNLTYNLENNLTNFKSFKIEAQKGNISVVALNSKFISNFKNIKTDIKLANIHTPQIDIIVNNIKTDYNKTITTTIPFSIIRNKQIDGTMLDTTITYNPSSKKLFLKSNPSIIKYKHIPIHTSTIKAYYDTNRLLTTIPTINIKDIKLNNNSLLLKDNNLSFDFQTNTLLSKQLIDILNKLNIQIPIYQKDGINSVNANIKYNLKTAKLHTNFDIEVNNSKLYIAKNSFLDINHSKLHLIDNNLTIKDTSLEFNKSILNLNYYIKDGILDLDKLTLKTSGIFNRLNLKDIIDITNYQDSIDIDLNKIYISLKELNLSVLIGDDILVKISKLSKFSPYIPYLHQYNINEGQADINISDKIDIKTNLETNQTILEQNLTPIKKLDFNITIDKNITIKNPIIKIVIDNETNSTTIKGGYKNLDINITPFVETKEDKNKSSNTNIKAYIKAKNSYILYNKAKIFSDKLSIEYNQSDAKIESLYKDRNVTILYNNKNLKLYGLKIKNKTFTELTNSSILNKPILTLFLLKNRNSDIIQGFIEIHKGYIKELKLLNNIIAFINLIPSLVTFQPVGFSSKGYKIKNGYIEYILYNKILYFKEISIKGENMSFDGQGYIDLDKKTIKMNIDVNILVKLVKDIPIVNYILLGKDGGITLKLTIDGTLDSPKVHSNTASNIIEAPLGIIKRTLLTPFRPFMKEK